jgi:hypothetical protein
MFIDVREDSTAFNFMVEKQFQGNPLIIIIITQWL